MTILLKFRSFSSPRRSVRWNGHVLMVSSSGVQTHGDELREEKLVKDTTFCLHGKKALLGDAGGRGWEEREIEIERLYQKLEHVRGSGINITKWAFIYFLEPRWHYTLSVYLYKYIYTWIHRFINNFHLFMWIVANAVAFHFHPLAKIFFNFCDLFPIMFVFWLIKSCFFKYILVYLKMLLF